MINAASPFQILSTWLGKRNVASADHIVDSYFIILHVYATRMTVLLLGRDETMILSTKKKRILEEESCPAVAGML